MKAIIILNNLYNFEKLLIQIQEIEIKSLQSKDSSSLTRSVSSQYDFIKFRLHLQSINPGDTKLSEQLYFQCTFRIDENFIIPEELYCIDQSREKELRDLIQKEITSKKLVWSTIEPMTSPFTPETTGYINIADDIASVAYLCNSGDNYRPGNFSGIIIKEDLIAMQQINRTNSKSIDYKKDYIMRDLEFTISLNNIVDLQNIYDDFQIGKMLILFSDNSSDNNKECGNKIEEKIKEEMIKFD